MKGIIEDKDLFWALFCTMFEKAKEQIEEIQITFRENPQLPPLLIHLSLGYVQR